MVVEECISKPVIDEGELQGLRASLGSGLRDLILDCLSDVEAACARLAKAAHESDGHGVKRAAHTLTGVFGQFACPRAACIARAVAGAPEADALEAAAILLESARTSADELSARATSD
ncbi:MAG: hypothetical protein ACK4MV_12615 [Beijerinckiaceae bacterium]